MSEATQTTPLLKPNAPRPDAEDNRSRFALYYQLNRLHKFPVGELLGFWPCAWALTMTAYRTKQPLHDYGWTLAVIALLSTLVHAAACVINDICDRELDRKERSKNRPLASGAISLGGAITCLAANWGFIVVWVLRVRDEDYRVPIVFFAGSVWYYLAYFFYFKHGISDSQYSWTVVCDTIYGCQDKKDDANAGIKSTALLFGSYVRPILAIFAAAFVAGIAGAGYLNHQERPYYIFSVGGGALHLMWQLVTLDDNDPDDCWNKFASNGLQLGFIVFAGMLIDYLKVLPY
ncbi:4-hydroxybenzoate polyprenyl transferase [Pholiota molesta]|nr:4-hydroxybenzoate polyprenyl transferase [Pholiota molesta]